MNFDAILLEIDAQIAKLEKAKALLSDSVGLSRKVGRPRKNGAVPRIAHRVLSAEAKAKIAAAQKKRWAKVRKTASKAPSTAGGKLRPQ